MYNTIKPEVKLTKLIKAKGFFHAVKNYKQERDMWCAINENYNLFLKNIGILKERSWVKYITTDTKTTIDDTTLHAKPIYVLHRLRLSDDLCIEDFEKGLKHLAEKMVLSVDFLIKENQEKIMKIGVKNYLQDRKYDSDYLQATHNIKSEKNPLERFSIYYENGEICIKIFYEDLPIRYYRPIKPKEGKMLIGMDTDYNPVWWDWTTDINMYIAGETGSGKTTIVHVFLINGLLYKTADFYLIDRKDSDFRIYANKRGVVAFGVTQDESAAVIQEFYDEFQRRRKLLRSDGKDYINMEEYNKKFPKKKLRPYALVVDEFADIAYECMKGSEIDMKSPLGFLLVAAAQIRNTGGHILLATQRPSADILKGILKAQMSAQLGLKVINKINSTIIIDEPGLENLSRFCFKVRLKGRLTDGMGYYLDTAMIKEQVAKIPDRSKNDTFIDVKSSALEALLIKIEEAEQAVVIAENFITQRENEMARNLKSAPANLENAKKKYKKAVSDLEKLKAERDKMS